MFINCPFCKALVATNPATDQPPEHCPRCAAKLRGVAADAPAPAVSPAPQDGQTGAPALDPNFLLQVPIPDAPFIQGIGDAAPSELSSQIHQTVTLGASTPTSIGPAAIAPIATMLKPADPGPASATTPDAAGRDEGAAVPTEPEPAADAAPPATAPVAVQTGAGDAQTPAQADQVAVADTPPADVPDSSADVATEAAASAPSDVEAAPDAADAPPAASEPGAAEVEAIATIAEAPAGTAAATQPAPRALPSFARRRAALDASGLHWKSAAAIVALTLLLLLQLLLADRDRLAADARWRPLLANVCGVLGCTLPPWREPEAFALLARDVRPHPSKPEVLRVTATFRNDARWPQPWPRVRLTLSDVNGNAVATRDFDARDYLGNAPAQAELRSGQSASIAMDVVESGPRSVAFDFDLL
ncbi:DUF3426 domain-containing protein [Luteimonas soli]|uniref:DUF3426 domain-containing protein n=1 Tax=Luteimonas soli TaxID=1648966 RepID=A0ABV7XMS5_9GAMM